MGHGADEQRSQKTRRDHIMHICHTNSKLFLSPTAIPLTFMTVNFDSTKEDGGFARFNGLSCFLKC